jgi:hypothetical protein
MSHIITNHQITGPDLTKLANGEAIQIDPKTIITLHPDCYVNAAFLGQEVIDPRAIHDARIAWSRSMISLFIQGEIDKTELAEQFGKVFPQA